MFLKFNDTLTEDQLLANADYQDFIKIMNNRFQGLEITLKTLMYYKNEVMLSILEFKFLVKVYDQEYIIICQLKGIKADMFQFDSATAKDDLQEQIQSYFTSHKDIYKAMREKKDAIYEEYITLQNILTALKG